MAKEEIGIRVSKLPKSDYDLTYAALAVAEIFQGKVNQSLGEEKSFIEITNIDPTDLRKRSQEFAVDLEDKKLEIQGLTSEDHEIVSETFPAKVVKDFQERISDLIS